MQHASKSVRLHRRWVKLHRARDSRLGREVRTTSTHVLKSNFALKSPAAHLNFLLHTRERPRTCFLKANRTRGLCGGVHTT